MAPQLQLNIKGISRAKSDYFTKLLSIHKIDVILLEETHASNEYQLQARGHLPGFTLAAAIYDHRYGSATYIRETLNHNHHSKHLDVALGRIYSLSKFVSEIPPPS